MLEAVLVRATVTWKMVDYVLYYVMTPRLSEVVDDVEEYLTATSFFSPRNTISTDGQGVYLDSHPASP